MMISFHNTANVGITKSLFGFAFNNDGTMMFLSDGSTDGTSTEKVYQLSLETSSDLSFNYCNKISRFGILDFTGNQH